MATFTRVNPALTTASGSGRNIDVLYSTLQMKVFKIVTVVNEETSLTTSIDGQIEQLAREFGTTAALFEADGENFFFIGDGHALDINTVARRADMVLGGTGALTGDGTTTLVTVTAPTSIVGM
jgi:hypothetical protein